MPKLYNLSPFGSHFLNRTQNCCKLVGMSEAPIALATTAQMTDDTEEKMCYNFIIVTETILRITLALSFLSGYL